MVLAFFYGVLDEKNLVDESEKTLAYACVLFVSGLSGEIVGDFALGAEFVL